MKILRIELPPFDYRVVVVIGEHKQCMRLIAGRMEDKGILETPLALGDCFRTKDVCPHIWIPRKPKTPREIGTLAHEAVHAALWLMDWAGTSMEKESGRDEFFGHTVSYIVSQVMTRG